MQDKDDLTVALLLDDIRDAKKLSDLFKKMGVIPFFYESLKAYWHGILDKKPTLSIIDVKKMTEGTRQLESHPLIKMQKIPIAFFVSEQTVPLLISTFKFFHLGIIRKEWSLKNQLQALVIRVNHFLTDKMAKEASDLRCKNLEQQVTKLLSALEKNKQEFFYQDRLKEIINQFENLDHKNDFFSCLETVFERTLEIEKFTYFELNPSGQKLVSPAIAKNKFVSTPSLWLGETCNSGIAPFAQEMAQQVTLELLGADLITLCIKGSKQGEGPRQGAEKIIIIKVNSVETLTSFDWNALEAYLTGFFARVQLRFKKVIARPDKYLAPWELLGELDRQFYGQLGGEEMRTIPENLETPLIERERNNIVLININLTKLLTYIRTGLGRRFYWKSFFEDFVNRLESQGKISIKTICYGLENINIIAGKEYSAVLFDFIKQYTTQFSYWKYFDQSDIALTSNLFPKVEMVPLSPRAYMNFMENNLEIEKSAVPTQAEMLLDKDLLYQSAVKKFETEEKMGSGKKEKNKMKSNVIEKFKSLKKHGQLEV